MKTYEQIFYEVLEDDLHNVKPEGIEGVRVRVAKAYAKQWVEEAAMLASSQAAIGGDVVNTVMNLLKEIDAQ